MHSDGDFPYIGRYGNKTTRKNADFTSRDLFSKYQYEFGQPEYQKTMELSYKYYTSDRGSPGDIQVPYYHARSVDTNQELNYLFTGKVINLTNNFRLQGYAHSNYSTYNNVEGLVPVHSKFDNRAYGTEGQMRTVLGKKQVFTYGLGTRYDELVANDFPANKIRTTNHVFLLSETNLPLSEWDPLQSIYIVPSLRYDAPSDFGGRVSPKIGTVLNIGKDWKTSLKFNIGDSYRAPTFNDLYWPEDAWTVGNPDLKPESGTDWDAGVRFQFPVLSGLYLESTYFQNKMKNLIVWESGQKWRPENVEKSKTSGIESSISFTPVSKLLTISANHTYLRAINQSTDRTVKGNYLAYQPRNTVNATLELNYWITTFQYTYNFTSRRYTNAANTIWLDPYMLSSVILAFKPHYKQFGFNLSFQIKNLLNEEYQVIKEHPVPGREFRFTLGVDMK